MLQKYINFVRGVSVNWTGLIGVVLTTSSFVIFVVLEFLRLMGFLTNSYVGLVTYMVFPALFIIGLILIPIGWRKRKKETGKTTKELLEERFDPSDVKSGFLGARVFLTIAIFTLINIIFLGVLSSRMLHFMDSAEFCGTACHTVMNPEWTTYQASPHARVKCVECHVGEGVDALINSKLNGLYQILSVTFNLYEKPIPTPVHQLRPAQETCEKCHWPDKFYGARMKSMTTYAKDEESTPYYTTLVLKVDAGDRRAKGGIHWHIAEENEIRYTSVNDEREEMIWVDVRQPDGSFKRYVNEELTEEEREYEEVRVLDCVDCHNRATHIYQPVEDAVDSIIELGQIDRSLPFAKREALAAVNNRYENYQKSREGISNQMHGFYQRNYPEKYPSFRTAIDSAVAALNAIYERNIHPEMNIYWGAYKSFLGHEDDGGCYRCHSYKMVAEDGEYIDDDCTICHSIAAYESEEPYQFMMEPDTSHSDYAMHKYLRNELIGAAEK